MDEVLKVFRVIAPEFSNLTDEEVTAMLELFSPMVSKNTFGLNGVYATAQGSSTDGSVAGIKREKEGDLEREYAIPDASDYMSLLYKTYYGRMYLQIMKLCAIGIKTRFG